MNRRGDRNGGYGDEDFCKGEDKKPAMAMKELCRRENP